MAKIATSDSILAQGRARARQSRIARALLMTLAIVSLAVGIIGVFVPGLPTTEFVLLSAWAAARSSPRLHAWLHAHRIFGPALRNWKNGRLVTRRAKWSATCSMTVCAVLMLYTFDHRVLALGPIACMALVLVWLWRRPEPEPEAAPAPKD